MKIKVITIGKTAEKYLITGIKEYEKRLSRFISFSWDEIPDISSRGKTSTMELKEREGDLILKKLKQSDIVVLFDAKGVQYSSEGFYNWFEKKALTGISSITFVVGGAYGFSDSVYQRSNEKISFSKMTFSHQMIRLILIEQIYRAYSIKHNLPYHH
ncbi:23S rRNA (pseudouridine(1915)-N(3))-methyltransferase RlmH [Salibacteraceae bacterium]|jgi:23S rRNA (pseudouridine1915-N3)-methyltransferase|nr:23S rRNA (pseudouridine(1915)-N(3))-methyltransferase RlmH [Salibacteraceae bacterium]